MQEGAFLHIANLQLYFPPKINLPIKAYVCLYRTCTISLCLSVCLYVCLSRVWRYRGGRDGHETLQQFMSFIGNDQGVKPVYPGVAAFAVPSSLSESFQVDISRDFGVRIAYFCILKIPFSGMFLMK